MCRIGYGQPWLFSAQLNGFPVAYARFHWRGCPTSRHQFYLSTAKEVMDLILHGGEFLPAEDPRQNR
jgi:hypothetical protein